MADRPTEDTVAIPRTPAPPASNGATNGTANGAASATGSHAAHVSNGSNGASRTTSASSATQTAPVTSPAPQPATPSRPSRQDRKAARAADREAQDARSKPKPRGRKARLRMTRIDPWSVMKTAFLLSIALGIVTVVSVLMVWTVLGAADVWQSVNKTVQDVVGGQDGSNFNIEDYVGTRRVVGFTMIIAAVDVVLVTAIATLGAFLYNMSASLLGGIEVTLAEDS